MFLRVWRDWGGVICLGGSNDVPDELTNGGIRTKTRSGCFATGSAKSPGGVSLVLDLPSNRFPLNGDSMGSARGRIEFLEDWDDPVRPDTGWAKAVEAHLRFLP